MKLFTDNEDLVKLFLNQISRQTGLGELDVANSLMTRGINHRGIGNPVSENFDQSGMGFIVRPNLNLATSQLITKTLTAHLATNVEYSIPRLVRTLLDPRGAGCPDFPIGARRHSEIPITTPLVDNDSPFIHLLSNNMLSLSGWPDIDMQTYSAEEGVARQTWGMVDDIAEINKQFTLTGNFQNVAGDPITLLFLVWLFYMGWVYTGDWVPYPESMEENEIDYATRIYRFVMDPTRTYIQKWAITGYCFPTAISIGASMNFNAEKPKQESSRQISVPFQCYGAVYNDPYYLLEFNKLVFSFCPELKKSVAGEAYTYVKLERHEVAQFNNRGLPVINTDTLELQWWVPVEEYNYWAQAEELLNGY